MFAFTKEQKQTKLARTNVSNYDKLFRTLHPAQDELRHEAITNAMADIVDIFTLLRSSYDISTPVKTVEDYRLLRVPGMPGIVLDYKWYPNENVYYLDHYYSSHMTVENVGNLQQYLLNAILDKKLRETEAKYDNKANKYNISVPFSPNSFDTLLNLEYILNKNTSINVVSSTYNREVCQQFAHSQNIDILISI